MKKSISLILFIALAMASCKKEKTSWDTSWSAPLVHGSLSLDDLIAPEYITTNSDNYLSIVYNEPVFSFSIDTLISLPDTSIKQKTALGFGVTVNPGFIWGDSYDQLYDLGEVELKEIIAKEGTITFKLKSEWDGKTKMTMDFPKVSLNGVPFVRSYYLPPGTTANPTIEVDEIPMNGYKIDLRGVSGDLYNTLSGDFIVESDETVNTYFVSIYDSLEYEILFENVELDYAKGYFGSYTFSDTTGFDLPFMNSVLAGSIDIDSIDMTVSIMNGFNIIAQANLSLLRGINSKTNNTVDLNFPQLGNYLNINPANGGLYDWTYSEYPISVNNSNSNVTNFIENLSDSILLGYELLINPGGNVTAGSDELFPGSTMDIVVNGEFPLEFGANNLTLTDTFDISYNGSSSYTENGSQIMVSYENGFPLGADATLYLLDDSDMLIDSISGDNPIVSGTYNTLTYATSAYNGTVTFNLTEADINNIEAASKMALIVSFTSDSGQKIKIDANAYFDFAVRSNLQISLHL